jgi:hypothetical protein
LKRESRHLFIIRGSQKLKEEEEEEDAKEMESKELGARRVGGDFLIKLSEWTTPYSRENEK